MDLEIVVPTNASTVVVLPGLDEDELSVARGSDSRPLYYYSDELGGLGGNWLDGAADQGTGWNPMDGNRHLAKVGVAGSNPVVRSK